MSRDIVERLRSAEWPVSADPDLCEATDPNVCEDAAKEIDRLRDLVARAYVEGALDFGGFREDIAAAAEARFPASDCARWRGKGKDDG